MASLVLLAGLIGCSSDGEGDDDDSNNEPDAGAQDARIPRPDTGIKPSDTGVGTASALDALAGRYLMRFDAFGVASSSGILDINSRASFLITAEVEVAGDKLVATERFCHQTALQECDKGCEKAGTVVDARVIEKLQSRTFKREYTVDGASFVAEPSAAQLGYDDPKDTPIPTSSTDKRVWDIMEGGAREGFLSTLKLEGLPPLGGMISCEIYGAQRVVSTFQGELARSGESLSFPTGAKTLDLSMGQLQRLGANMPLCETQGEAPIDRATVSIVPDKRSSDDCPSVDEFDTALPGGPL